ncbi:MAG: substrate-binding domain-containing protein [Acidobacteriaceae bacterium]|nr:substrate-binding domain-containing protein [Acidobacteriaceae bacterium]
MRTAQRVLIAAALPAALLSLSGCAGGAHSPTEKYILVASNTKIPYWQSAQAGLIHATNEMKVKSEMVGPDAYDAKGEHDAFQGAVAQKPAGILVSAADATILTPDINAALQQNIPVITIDSDAPDSKRLFFVGTDNYNAGTLGGKLLNKLLNGKGNVVVFTMPTQPNLKDRLHGYQDALNEGSVKISQVVDMKGDATVVFDTTRKLLDSKDKPDAFVCLEAISCPEVGEVVNRENLGGKVSVIAMDTDPRTTDWIQKGVISATIAQKPFTMAYYGTKLLDDLHHHPPSPLMNNWAQNATSPVPEFVDTGAFIIDKSSLDAFLQQNKSAASGQ